MGRAPLIFLFVVLISFKAAAFDFSVHCSEDFDNYYFGGEHVYFYCRIEPESSSDAKAMDGIGYELESQLDSVAILVEVKLKNGKVLLHPLPGDSYTSANGTTRLGFYVPESDGVDEIVIKVQGYVPVVDSRLENLTTLYAFAERELVDLKLKVVNRQKMYSDIIEFSRSSCADKRKLEEARSYYDDGKYSEAERLLSEVEEAVLRCRIEEMRKAYGEELDKIENELSELKKDFLVLNFTLERDAESIENYAEVSAKLVEFGRKLDAIESEIDGISKMIDSANFDGIDAKLEVARQKIEEAKTELQAVKDSIRKKGLDLFTIAAVAAGVGLAAISIAAVIVSRRRDKW